MTYISPCVIDIVQILLCDLLTSYARTSAPTWLRNLSHISYVLRMEARLIKDQASRINPSCELPHLQSKRKPCCKSCAQSCASLEDCMSYSRGQTNSTHRQ